MEVEAPQRAALLRQLCFGREAELAELKLLVVAAHPDDECIGAGAQLGRWNPAKVLYVTGGVPRNPRPAAEAGFLSREAYALARQEESRAALALAGTAAEQLEWLGFVDQEVSLELPRLTSVLVDRFHQLRPDVIVTQPYEGGHPDHDATAFAVHQARRLLCELTGREPALIEMTAYHNRAGEMAASEFIPGPGCEAVLVGLSPVERAFKQRLFDCFKTQAGVLRYFPVAVEQFRLAPHYEFTAPPHPGTLYYELFDWGMDRVRWCQLARQAVQILSCSSRRESALIPADGQA